MIRVHVFYSGRVQDVGFRFIVQRFAVALHLKGWVKNLADGRVETVLEGDKDAVEQCCVKIENHFKGNIRNIDLQHEDVRGAFEDFQIRY